MSRPLLSEVSFVRLSLQESSDDRVRVRGEFAKCGVATENKRVYPKQVWEKEIKRLGEAMKDRRVFGEVDHPSDGQTKLARVSHIVTGLSVENGLVIGEAEILPTEAGKNLLALMQANVPVGVSSRGFGSVKTNESGQDVVQEDYKLVTFDFVADPADVDAYPQVSESVALFEGVQFDMDDEQSKALEFARRIEAEKTGKKVEAQETLREEFARDILGNLTSLKDEIRDEIRQEMLADPQVGKAKQVLEAVRELMRPYILPEDAATIVADKDDQIRSLEKQVAEKDLRVKELEEENDSLANMAKEVGYRFYVERMLSNDPEADAIRSLLGDLTNFESADDLKARVEAIKSELDQKAADKKAALEAKAKEVAEARREEQSARDALESKLTKIENMMAAERAKREKMEQALAEAKEENQELSNRLYAEERIASHPRASRVRSLMENVRSSRKAVDALIESEREPVRDSDDLQEVRSRIRSNLRGGTERSAMTESANRPRSSEEVQNYRGLGASIDSLRRLSGIEH